MLRKVEPEMLDMLPADDPAAVRSRRDLRLTNAIMGNHRWLAGRVRALLPPDGRVLELGAGDGTLGPRLAKGCGAAWLTGLDLAPRPAIWPAQAGWRQADVFAVSLPEAEVVVANLFLHHFETDALEKLGARLPSACRVILASEPARRRWHLWQGRLLSFVARFSHVTRHDLPISIRAGFLDDELPRWLKLAGWKIRTFTTFFGAYRLEAHRI